MRVGLDFDNTIAQYDDLFAALCVEEGYFDVAPLGGKNAIRDALRGRPGGEADWRRLQALAYGPRMGEARMFDGVATFLKCCRFEKIAVSIVSHKTRHPACREIRTDLRQSALAWMTQQGFFSDCGFGLTLADIHFEDSRAAKVARIRALDCTVFVDDLKEVFDESGFPPATHRILFSPQAASGAAAHDQRLTACSNWSEIADEIVGQSAVA